MTLRRFKLELSDFLGKQLPAIAVAAQKKLTLDAFAGVVRKSPVDTGRFRGNWQVSIQPGGGTVATVDRQPRGSAPGAQRQTDALSRMTSLQPYALTYIANNLPYAEPLENGWSDQAPGGMVALTIAELSAAIYQGNEL